MHKTMDINYTLTPDNLHIEDSYKVSKIYMEAILRIIYERDYTASITEQKFGIYPAESKVWYRSDFSLKCEWVCHNFLYSIGYKRERTKDVDLNADCKIEWLYKVLGVLVWVFVK